MKGGTASIPYIPATLIFLLPPALQGQYNGLGHKILDINLMFQSQLLS